MATNYPQQLDTDSNLIVVAGTDGLIPAHHNNLKDAIEAIELTAGPIDNTLAGRVAPTFQAPIMHQVWVRLLAARNPYQPFGVPASTDLYAVRGTLPAGATLDAGLTADFATDAPYLRLVSAGASAYRYLHLPLGGGAPDTIIARVAACRNNSDPFVIVGFTETGQTPGTGIEWETAGGWLALQRSTTNSSISNPSECDIAQAWAFVQIHWNGTTYQVSYSRDGMLWRFSPTTVGGAAPSGVVIGMYNVFNPSSMWVDFLQQGVGAIGA